MNIAHLPIALLGIPVARVPLRVAADQIVQLIEAYHKDLRPRYITTLDVHLLAQVHNWNWGETGYPELLQIMREANFVAPASLPILWLSWSLGESLPERINEIDLVSTIAEKLGSDKASCLLLGKNEKVLKLCSLYLQALYSDLKISGTLYPTIVTQGEELLHSEEKDLLLVEHINHTSSEALFLNLSRPKQEVWYNRIKNKLHVPIILGVNGSFEKITGIFPKEPRWMHRWGFGRLFSFRLFQEPARTFKHVCSAIKFTYMAIPLFLFHTVNRILFWLFHKKKDIHPSPTTQLFISLHQTIAIVKLPPRLDFNCCKEISEESADLFSQDVILFDFQKVRHIDLVGMGLIVTFWQRAIREKKQIYGIGLTADMTLLMRLHRIYDLVRSSFCSHLDDLMTRLHLDSGGTFYDSIQQDHQLVTISFFGRLDHELDVDGYLKKMEPIMHQKECSLDFTYCTYIDNRAIGFLVKLSERRGRQNLPLKLVGLSSQLKRQLRLAKVLALFLIP